MIAENDNPGPNDSTSSGSAADAAAAPTDHRTGRVLAGILGLAAVVLLVDQLTKMWAQSALEVGAMPKPLIGELIQLRLIYNPGAALSIASGQTWILSLLSAGVVVFVIVTARKIRSTAWALALGLVLGGALGNLGDRLFREPGFLTGHVVDFIDYGPFIGNVADIAIVAAAVLIGYLALRGIGPDGRRGDEAVGDTDRAEGTAVASEEHERPAVTSATDEAAPTERPEAAVQGPADDGSARTASTEPGDER